MTLLIVQTPALRDKQEAIRFGGLPLASVNQPFDWPVCSACKGHMQFIGQLPVDSSTLALIFMCQNDPGLCDEWDPNAGGNVVKMVRIDNLDQIDAPTEGKTRLPFEIYADLLSYEGSYGAALKDSTVSKSVLGKFGGSPDWIQSEETPTCGACGLAMQFVAQLEQATDGKSEVNFGGGLGYMFKCPCGIGSAKFLWQC
jgi:hypothetical protein